MGPCSPRWGTLERRTEYTNIVELSCRAGFGKMGATVDSRERSPEVSKQPEVVLTTEQRRACGAVLRRGRTSALVHRRPRPRRWPGRTATTPAPAARGGCWSGCRTGAGARVPAPPAAVPAPGPRPGARWSRRAVSRPPAACWSPPRARPLPRLPAPRPSRSQWRGAAGRGSPGTPPPPLAAGGPWPTGGPGPPGTGPAPPRSPQPRAPGPARGRGPQPPAAAPRRARWPRGGPLSPRPWPPPPRPQPHRRGGVLNAVKDLGDAYARWRTTRFLTCGLRMTRCGRCARQFSGFHP
jgi:hypothetical protein